MKIQCPSCLVHIEEKELKNNGYVCPQANCQRPVPPSYVADYAQHPPVIVSAVGLRGHGKTVYFASVFRTLYLLTECWPEFYHTPLDDAALRKIQEEAERLEWGELPAPTPFNPNNPPEAVLIRVSGIPMYPRCTLIFYDVSGESFTADMEKMGNYVPFLQRARAVMFLVSVPDLSARPAKDMEELLSRYVGSMRHQRVNTRQQNLVVVYTKADQMDFSDPHWREMDAHLRQGLGAGIELPESYRKKMVWASRQLRDYTRNTLRAHHFLAMANGNFQSVNFSMVSALGASPETGAEAKQRFIEVTPVPSRIMDPLLWIVEKSQPAWKQALWWKRNRWKLATLFLTYEMASVVCSFSSVLMGAQVGFNLWGMSEVWQWLPLRNALEVSGEFGGLIGTVGALLAFPMALKIVRQWLD